MRIKQRAKDFLKNSWKTQPNLFIGVSSAIIFLVGFSLISLNPEFGVSKEGIEECLDQSDRTRNKFSAQKIYKKCLRNIDKEIAKEKKEKLEANKKRKEVQKRKDSEIEAQKLFLAKKYEIVVNERKQEFIKAGWDYVTEGKHYWGLAKDKVRLGKSFVIFRTYYLPKYEEPLITPENYFTFNKYKRNSFTNDPEKWLIVDCDSRKRIYSEKDFTNIDNDPLAALNTIFRINYWNKPSEKGFMEYSYTDYACSEK